MSGSSMHAPRARSSASGHADLDPSSTSSVGKQTRVGSPVVAPPSEVSAIAVVEAARVILAKEQRGLIYKAPTNAYGPLSQLHAAVVGRSVFYPMGMTPAKRLEIFDAAVEALQPWVKVANVQTDDGLNEQWVHDGFTQPVREKRAELAIDATRDTARQRIDDAILLPGGRGVVELPDGALDDETAAAYGKALVPSIDTLVKTMATLDKSMKKFGKLGDKLHERREERRTGNPTPDDAVDLGGPHRLETALATLRVLRAGLVLGDAWEKAKAANDDLAKYRTYTDLVKAALDTTGAATVMTANLAGYINELGGRADAAKACFKLGESVGKTIGTVTTAVGIVQGFVKLVDPDANASQMLEGAVDITSGGLGLLGTALESSALGAAGVALSTGFILWKLDMALHAKVKSDLAAGGLRPRFETMAKCAVQIQTEKEFLEKAQLLLAHEPDPGENAKLALAVVEGTEALDSTVDSFLAECTKSGDGVDTTRPGNNPHIAEFFAPLQALRRMPVTPDAALRKAKRILIAIKDVFDDAANFVRLSMGLDRAVPE